MMGVLGWTWDAISNLTFKQVCQSYDAKLLYDWDHTAFKLAMMDGDICTNINLNSKKKAKPRYPNDFHPYRAKRKRGMSIDASPEKMSGFKALMDAVCGKVN